MGESDQSLVQFLNENFGLENARRNDRRRRTFLHRQLSNEGSAMAQTFPWPVTDEELVVNRALENVVAAYGDAGPLEEAWLRKSGREPDLRGLRSGYS
jgi:hypothetical protein